MKNLLFIGNSATYVHNVPQTLVSMANKAGYDIASSQITPGGCELAMHADITKESGIKVFSEIEKGYDIVFLQDNGNCITSEAKRIASLNACRALGDAIVKSGAELYYYVRPPYGIMCGEYDSFEQCKMFDRHFGGSAAETGAKCIYVNRAFAYAMKNTNIKLWGEDNAHVSIYGAYLTVCVFFATLFKKSARGLDVVNIESEIADVLSEVADKIVFDGVIPWEVE